MLGFAGWLFFQGYGGDNNPQSVDALAFPLSFLVVLVAGLPAALVCAGSWTGYFAVTHRIRPGPG